MSKRAIISVFVILAILLGVGAGTVAAATAESTTCGIAAFAKDWWWSKNYDQDGEYGECSVDITIPSGVTIDSATLSFTHGYSQMAGSANGEAYIKTSQQVTPKDADHDFGTRWYGDVASTGTQAGSFTTVYEGSSSSFDITSFISSNIASKYYVAIKNLASPDIGIGSIKVTVTYSEVPETTAPPTTTPAPTTTAPPTTTPAPTTTAPPTTTPAPTTTAPPTTTPAPTTTAPPTTTPAPTTTAPPTTTSAPTTTAPPITGFITITSDPVGADVLFDGVLKGSTPLTIRALPVGVSHKIAVSKPGYYKEERIVSATTRGAQVSVKLEEMPTAKNVPHLTVSQTAVKTGVGVGEETLLDCAVLNNGDADAYDVKLTMEIGCGLSASFVMGASKAGGLVYWAKDVIKEGQAESATLRVTCQDIGQKFMPMKITYKDESGNKYTDDTSLSITCSEALAGEKEIDSDGDGWSDEQEQRVGTDPYIKDTDNDGIIDSQDLNPLVPEEKKGICGPTALLGIALLPLGLWGLFKKRR